MTSGGTQELRLDCTLEYPSVTLPVAIIRARFKPHTLTLRTSGEGRRFNATLNAQALTSIWALEFLGGFLGNCRVARIAGQGTGRV